MRCPKCKTKVYSIVGYETVFRCNDCNFVGLKTDFKED